MELFATSSNSRTKSEEQPLNHEPNEVSVEESGEAGSQFDDVKSFQELGCCEWICNVTRAIGYREPTAIQKRCIPNLLARNDVLAGAETGSGKTASYILPLLQILSEDPYGIFAVILAPTRELAIQISDQISILGSAANVTVSLVVGGLNFVEQSQRLAQRPHFIVATPGRFRQQLETADPPNLKKIQFVVFDEADKLISTGFAEDLEVILQHMNPRRTTAFFSATITNSLKEISSFALKPNYASIDFTVEQKIPSQLTQQYILTPSKIKICYLIALLFRIFERNLTEKINDIEEIEENPLLAESKGKGSKLPRANNNNKTSSKNRKRQLDDKDPIASLISSAKEEPSKLKKTTIIIFVDTCQRCHELSEILTKFSFPCVALHSLLSQSKRLSALSAFKSAQATILLATDVASRGLDIPDVNYVINFNLPKICSDYVHRVGRTSRAGRSGTAITLITQHDIHLLKKIEGYCETRISALSDITPRHVKGYLVPVAQVVRTVRLDFENSDLLEIQERKKLRKQVQRQELRKYSASNDNDD